MNLRTMTACVATAAALAAALVVAGPASAHAAGGGGRWSGAWAAAPQAPMPGDDFLGPNWSMEGFSDQTVRQVVRLSTGGGTVRVRLSNLYGNGPLRVAGATIAKAGAGAAVEPGTIRRLTFGGSSGVTIPAGHQAGSDATPLAAAPLESLTVTLYLAKATGPSTFHEGGQVTTYRADGDHRFDVDAGAFGGETSHSFYYLTGVDVAGGHSRNTVVAFGDSITDGHASTVDADNRYPDELAERLVAAGRPLGVANAGINGNMLLSEVPCSGEKAVTRFRRDVAGQPGVRTAIVLFGTNDIFRSEVDFGCGLSPRISAADLIAGHRALIKAAHAHGIRVVGGTIIPLSTPFFPEPALTRAEAIRDEVNHWVRTSGEFDAVVDFDQALADPASPDVLNPVYDSGDGIHPNDAGYRAMAAAVDLSAL